MQRTCKNIILLLLLLAVHFLKAQPTTRIQLPQLQAAPNTDTVWVIVSSGDTAIWAIADTLTTAGGGGGGGITPYVSTENAGAVAFDTLDFTVNQSLLSTPLYLQNTTVGSNRRVVIGHDFGLIDANEAVNDDDFLPYYTGAINRRMTIDTLLGFDTLQLSGNTLRISQRLDGDATYEVDLSSLSGGSGTSDTLTLAADSGTPAELTNGSTFTVSGGYGLSSAISGTTVTMDADSAIWATVSSLQDTAAAIRGDVIQPYVSFNGSGHVPFDTLDFFATGAISVTSSTSATNQRVSIAHSIGNIVINEAIASNNYLPWWTGAIDRRATVDTLLGFDVFQLNGTNLEISQRLDGDATYSVDLSSLTNTAQVYAIATDATSAVYGLTTTASTLDTLGTFASSSEFSKTGGTVTFSGTETEWYLVNFHSNFSCNTQGATISFIMYDGSAPQFASVASTYIETANEVYNISGTVLMNLQNTDTITIRAATDAGTPNITVDYVTFTIIRI